jgi:hypothetical protein
LRFQVNQTVDEDFSYSKRGILDWDFKLTKIKIEILVQVKEDRRIGILG